ncbi:DSBA-like thioredoxin domain-containing protein [Colletotrichum orchidophilum]|uniref:DSBA-like thioredoxin domain-containing protein n=1 Tax=Colletotrichum orchidophilum TaxID=1209926 RepID=A0A1G4AN81_9PEZI|nr:DSBA-like thioredoxin domain-containing protein [Colletotrichum orchidophilum]OHE90503.1 DSBA-like thioredoxin domain-containing protein [Colletotrichum orchidophilum]
MPVIKIEAVTDLLCPWCYVGKRNLESAISQYRAVDPSAEFEVIWKPFYLNPALKSSGYDKREIYTTRFSLGGDLASAIARVTSICASAGIRPDVAGTTGNTRQSHKLLALALARKGPTAQDRLLEALFRGHFEEGADITDRHYLVATAAAAAGLDVAEAEAALDSDRAGELVDGEVVRARKAGVTGVPTFTVQGRWRVGGNQEPDVFLRVFERVNEDH